MPSLAMQVFPAPDESVSHPWFAARALLRRAFEVGTQVAAGEPLSSVGQAPPPVGPPAPSPSDPYQPLVLAWIILQLAGQITLPILVATMVFHKRVSRRNPTIINLCIAWTAATIPPELLFYAGKYKGPQPSVMLCLLQAATISAVPPMVAVAYLSVVIHACTVMYEIRKDIRVRPFTVNLRMVSLLAAPYVAFLAFALYIAFVGAGHPIDVVRDTFFCVVTSHDLSTPVFVFTITIVVFTLAGQCWISYFCYKDYREKRYGPNDVSTSRGIDMQFLIRMISFTVFEVVILVACVSSILNPRFIFAKLLLATPPFSVFLIFATSKDILSVWFPCFFRRSRLPPQTELFRSGSVLNVSRADRESHMSKSVYSQHSASMISSMHQSQGSITSVTSLLRPGVTGPTDTGSYRSGDPYFNVQPASSGASLKAPPRLYIPSPKQRSWEFDGPGYSTVTIQSGSSRMASPMDAIRSFKASSPASRSNQRPF